MNALSQGSAAMQLTDFPGARLLIDTIDEAVQNDCQQAITDCLRSALCRIIRQHDVTLPACIFEPLPDRYARREIYHSPTHGYSVIAMTWGPGQGTLIHDHSGMWCVEGVFQGALEITQYELAESDGERFRFLPVGSMQAGSAGSLIPPHEYHTIRNPSDDSVSVTLHIYRGAMSCCSVFQPAGDGWYQRNERKLGFDAAA
jgi:predicted metal-dependent enzyme (double-stranded beta helix superfamily)